MMQITQPNQDFISAQSQHNSKSRLKEEMILVSRLKEETILAITMICTRLEIMMFLAWDKIAI